MTNKYLDHYKTHKDKNVMMSARIDPMSLNTESSAVVKENSRVRLQMP